ncbi:bifunctional DNA primase/polymerase [Streptomyces sp. NPDC004539]|uniref:bifunctional DNA primase/polymerase n=1 Tax=Streptomyces sp. NPDC004539 TaxID=3154280 RepID=UPI0033B6F500
MHHNTPVPLLRAALAAVERGAYVFPLVPREKRPAIESWERRATRDIERVTRCWTSGDYNFGIATGPSRLVVVDLDVPKHDQDTPPAHLAAGMTDGADALALLAEQHGRQVDDTYTVRTPSGGTHLYFTSPAGVELRNTAGKLGWKIDTRANGGYVVGAGSVIDGTAYTVVRETAPVPLPDWLTKLLVPAELPPQCPVAVPLMGHDRRSAYLVAAVNGELARVRRAPEGERNNALYQASVALGQLVAGGELTEREAVEPLIAQAIAKGLGESDSRRTVASGLRAGVKRPRMFGSFARRAV